MASILKCLKNTGSYYFNYKGTFSVELLGLVDADYKFIYVDVRCNGRNRDGVVFQNASLSKAFKEKRFSISAARSLPGSDEELPFIVVVDDAFPLKSYLIKSCPHKHLIAKF